MKISIICIYNNKSSLNKYLLKTLKKQEIDYQLILIDNCNNKFDCASDALNYGGNKATGDLLIFIHQDVELFENNLKDIVYYCKSLENFGVAGIAGTDLNGGFVKSNGIHHIPSEEMASTHLNNIEQVQTLDEVLLIIPQNIFNKFKFNSEICNDWHLYGADYCLQLIKNGYDIYVLPIKFYHVSNGSSMSVEYFKTLKNILNEYKNDFKVIHTVCWGSHKTKNSIKINLMLLLYKLRLKEPLAKFLKKYKKIYNNIMSNK